jgi:hypothetical protein
MTRRLAVTLIFAGLFVAMQARSAESGEFVGRWDFDVYLNDKKLGKHLFEVTEVGDMRRVRSEANFKYKFLFIPAYRYEHKNSEYWAENCLTRFEAQTKVNGKHINARGEMNGAEFRVAGEDGMVELPECVMSFAYWNPKFLEQKKLLNPQSGEYLDVKVEPLEPTILEVRGEAISANPYRVTADKINLVVWYSDENEWLALESVAKGDNIIRYELS